MLISPRNAFLTVAAIGLIMPLPAQVDAQTPLGTILTFVVPSGKFGSNNYTNVVVNSLAAAKKFCGALDSAYRVDCLAERIGAMANEIPDDSDYAEVRGILAKTSNDMANLARANQDRTLPRATAATSEIQTTRPLTPVAPAAASSTNAQAAAILDATTTLLLRTPDDDSDKKQHYTRIAEALGSNKTLLRSA